MEQEGSKEGAKEGSEQGKPLAKTSNDNEATTTDKSSDPQPNDKSDSKEESKTVSKNQLKRQQKWEQAQEVKRRRKEQEKAIKHAKAKAQGRDIAAEQQQMEERRKDGSGRVKREAIWKERFEKNASKYQVCVDCSFETAMTTREVGSLSSQLRYCYSGNKRAKHPVRVKITSLGGETRQNLSKVSGFDQWANRAFDCTSTDLGEAYADKSKLVYLTSDSENVLETLEDDKVYIIGGIVDRNRLKRAAIDRAEGLGIATAKLPIGEYLDLVTTKVLTCNHVFEILVKYREHGNDWKKAFLDVLPVRKDAKTKDS